MSNQNTVTPGLAIFEPLAPLGYPLIRITAGLMLMPHGAQKLFGWFGGYGLEATRQFSLSDLAGGFQAIDNRHLAVH